MAPSRSRPGDTIRRWIGEGPQLLPKSALYRRQNRGGDDENNDGRNRFRFGNNNRDGDRDNDDNDDEGRFGNFFRSGNSDGNGNGNRNGDGDGDGNRDGNGSRFGNGNGNGDGDGDRDGNGSRFGDGFRDRFGDGFGRDRNGNNGDDSTRSISSSSAETPPPSTSTTAAPPEPTSTELAASSAVPVSSVSSTIEASSTFNPGVILLQSAVTGGPTAETNPTVTAFIPLMTPGDVGGSANLSGSGGNGEAPNASSAAEPSVSPTPFPDAPPTGGPMDNDNNGGDGAVNRLEVSRAGMDPTAERILISVGSIGGFILACFVIWMVWRSMKKSRNDGNNNGRFDGLRRSAGFRIPFFRRRSWQTLDDTPNTRSPPPSYREKMGSAHDPSMEGFFGPDMVQQPQPPPQSWAQNMPEVAVVPGPDPRQSSMYQPPIDPRNTYNAANRPHITLMTNIPPYPHQPQPSFSSTSAAHFSSPMTGHNTPSPLQNGVSPVSYYNQPLLAQQYGTPYNPIYRQPSHAISEVSSLSSGFGDVDGIYITESIVAPPAPTATPNSASNSPQQYTARFSWMSHPQEPAVPTNPPSRQTSNASRDGGRRETVYTQSSEDRPARFRSVRSWVNQQTGRIKRAQQRGPDDQASPAVLQVPGNPGIPGIHNPPSEQSFGMMMDDEEKPRRVEEVVGLGKMG